MNMDWHALTTALRNQYKTDYSDFDILDDIRKRKQRQNENFDDYLEIILAMTDRLRTPIADRDLCETLIRNHKTEVRHELLHLKISSVSHLRREVSKHERFINDLQLCETRRTNKGRVAEIHDEDHGIDKIVVRDEVCVVQHEMKCWNCDKAGHTYIDCLEKRRVFCYGCGAKDTYKPNCIKCSKNFSGHGQMDVRRTH